MKRIFWLTLTHIAALALGMAIGIYVLPILAAPPAPGRGEVGAVAAAARYSGEFRRDLAGSDALHWGEGRVSVSPNAVALDGRLAPGPAYRLYLVREWVETEQAFLRAKPKAVPLGDIKTFENFIVPVPAGIDVAAYTTVVVWCEAFSQFITAARYR